MIKEVTKMVILEILKCLFTGIGIGIEALLKTLSVYQQFDGIKETIISVATGIPLWLVSLIFAVPTLIGIGKMISNHI